MNWLVVVGLRMFAVMVAMLAGLFRAAMLYSLGDESKAVSALVVCVVVTWLIRPDAEQVAAYMEFQRKRREAGQQ